MESTPCPTALQRIFSQISQRNLYPSEFSYQPAKCSFIRSADVIDIAGDRLRWLCSTCFVFFFSSIRFFHQSHNTVLFGGLFTLKQWIISSLKHDTVPRVNKLYCFYVKNPPKRIALWDRENSQCCLPLICLCEGTLSCYRTKKV